MIYNELFTWEATYGDHVVTHNDGACSLMINWSGLDIDIMTDAERKEALSSIYNLVTRFSNELSVEFHLWREFNDAPAKRYIDYSKNIKRNHEFAKKVRHEIADHLGPMGISNEVAIVLTLLPDEIPKFFARSKLNREAKRAELLLKEAGILTQSIPGGRLATINEYSLRVLQTYNRDRYLNNCGFSYDTFYSLSDQLISDVPAIEEKTSKINGYYTKTLFGLKYPDAPPGWFVGLAKFKFPYHIVHALHPTHTRNALKSAGTKAGHAEGLSTEKGDEFQKEKKKDLDIFREYVAENGLSILQNLYVIHVYGETLTEVEANSRLIRDYFEKKIEASDDSLLDKVPQAGDLRDSEYIQKLYLRRGLPGQCYLANRYRPDEHEQIVNMLPVQVWPAGDERAEIIRLTDNGQLVTFGKTNKAMQHLFVGGNSRAGKDGDHVCEVAELAPLGVNYKVVEISPTYRWVIEANGGKYCTLEPDKSVINPLPPYSVANTTDPERLPLSSGIAGNSVSILAPLLKGGEGLTAHDQSAAESGLQHLYARQGQQTPSPVLGDLKYELENLDPEYHTPDQINSAKNMASHLTSFLSRAEGQIFNQQDNVDLTGDLVGLDLSEIWDSNKNLAVFYLMFASMRFVQEAFACAKLTYTVLNELFLFVDLAPERVKALCSSLARMGGKKSSFLVLITQHINEVEAIDKAVLAQMAYNYLCYMGGDHNEIADRLSLSDGALARWKKFPYPAELNYREKIMCHDKKYYHQHLSLPPFMLNLANSSPGILEIKEAIANEFSDPFERMDLIEKKLRGNLHA